jgi:hypothetical protein
MMKDKKILGKRPLFKPRGLPASGTIRLSEIKTEFGKGNNLLDYLGEGGVASSAPIKLTDFYGTSSALVKLPDDPAVYGEWYASYGSTYGSGSGLNASWYWSCNARLSSNTKAHQLTSVLLAPGTYTCTYDCTLTSSANGAGLYLSRHSTQSTSPITGFANNAMKTQCSSISGAQIMSNGSTKMYNDNGTMVTYDYNAGGTGRRSSSFTFTVPSNTSWSQIGLQLSGYADGSSNYHDASCTIHSLTIT